MAFHTEHCKHGVDVQLSSVFTGAVVPIIGTLVQLALATPPTQPRTQASERTIIVTTGAVVQDSIY